MKCQRFRDWISLDMDGQLAPEHVVALDDHLLSCAECRQYQEDLLVGTRMIRATEPELPDNFDWNLQLRLSQAMREAAQNAHPWEEPDASGWRRWLGRAGVSAAVGLAAVLAVAIMVPGTLPTGGDNAGRTDMAAVGNADSRLPVQDADAEYAGLADASRRPLTVDLGTGRGLQRRVSSNDLFGDQLLPDMSSTAIQRIRHLETENETMKRRLYAKDRQIQLLQAQLDSLAGHAVDRN